MTQAPYRVNYTQGPDGKVSIAVDIHGPLPDPLAGLSAEERRAVAGRSLSLSEYTMLWSVRHMPAAARQVVWVEILARRRQADVHKLAPKVGVVRRMWRGWKRQAAPAAAPVPVAEPDMEPEQAM